MRSAAKKSFSIFVILTMLLSMGANLVFASDSGATIDALFYTLDPHQYTAYEGQAFNPTDEGDTTVGFRKETDGFGNMISYTVDGLKLTYEITFEKDVTNMEILLSYSKTLGATNARIYVADGDNIIGSTTISEENATQWVGANEHYVIMNDVITAGTHRITIEVNGSVNFYGIQFYNYPEKNGLEFIDPTTYSYFENGKLNTGAPDANNGFSQESTPYGNRISYVMPDLTFVYKNVYFEEAPYEFLVKMGTANSDREEKIAVYVDGERINTLNTKAPGIYYDNPSEYVAKVNGLIERDTHHDITIKILKMGVNFYGFQFLNYAEKNAFELINPHEYDVTNGDATAGFRKETDGTAEGLENYISNISENTTFTYKNVVFDKAPEKLIVYAGYEASEDNLNKKIQVAIDNSTELAAITTVISEVDVDLHSAIALSADVIGKISEGEVLDLTVKMMDSDVNFFGIKFIPSETVPDEPEIPDIPDIPEISDDEDELYRNPYEWLDITTYDELKGSNPNLGVHQTDNGPSIQYTDPVTYIKYSDYNFSVSPLGVETRFAKGTLNYMMEIRADSPTGALIAKFEGEGGHKDWVTVDNFTSNLEKEITGIHDIYIVFPSVNINLYGFRFIGIEGMDVAQVTPDTAEISPYIRSISAEFTNYIDEKTVKNNVIMEDNNGESVDLRYEVDGKKLVIKFGILDFDTEYTLKLLDGIKSINGYSLTAKDYSYIVGSETGYKIEENFSSSEFVTGSYPAEKEHLSYSGEAVVGEENGNKYVELSSEDAQQGVIKLLVDFELDEKVYLDIKYKVKLLAGSNALLGVINEDMNGAVLGVDGISSGNLSYSETDENGFYDVNIIIKKESGKSVISIYDINSGKINTVYAGNLSEERCDLILASVTQGKVAVTDIKCVLSSFDVLENNGSEIDVNRYGLELVFNDEVKADTLENILLKEIVADRFIEYTSELSADNRSVIINPAVFLKDNTRYVVDYSEVENLKAINNPDGIIEFVTKDPSAVILNPKWEFDATNQRAKFDADIFAVSGEILILARFYDEYGKLMRIKNIDFYDMPLYVDGVSKKEWENSKVSVWYIENNYIEPVFIHDEITQDGVQ